jgi:dipeptidyl aminopeptidase/acylaminoacyl peptidase
MAVLLRARRSNVSQFRGSLSRVSVAGGTPREILEDVEWADWTFDGTRLAVVRVVGDKRRLEFPIGNVLYETDGWIQNPRISPGGDVIAFWDHPIRPDISGSLAVVDASGTKRTLSPGWVSAEGLAWSPSGDEVWFTATRTGIRRGLHAVSLSGRERLVTRTPSDLVLHDVGRDGRVLAAANSTRIGILALAPGEPMERDLSWFDTSTMPELSEDGRTLLFSEGAAVYLRGTDGSPAVRLGEWSGPPTPPESLR